jgi:DNA repair exonuclease SbcCD nuclease subunit
MKIALISDLHIKLHKKNNKFLPHIIKSLDHFYEQCEQRQVDKVFILGDVFHVKDIIGVETQHHAIIALHKIMKRFDTYLIPGNHDILSRNSTEINSVSIFKHSCNFIDDLKKFTINKRDYYFLPFFNDEIIKEKLATIKLERESYLLTHLGLRGFNLDNGHEDIFSELKAEDIDRGFKRIFSGHYHSYQTVSNITYVSSPFESHFGDHGHHGWCFYDDDIDQLEFYENELSPRFVYQELNKNSMTNILNLKNCFIKLKIKKNIEQIVLLKLRDKLLQNNFDVQFEWNITNNIQKIAIAKDWENYISEDVEDIIKSYVKENEFDMDKQMMLDYLFN